MKKMTILKTIVSLHPAIMRIEDVKKLWFLSKAFIWTPTHKLAKINRELARVEHRALNHGLFLKLNFTLNFSGYLTLNITAVTMTVVINSEV